MYLKQFLTEAKMQVVMRVFLYEKKGGKSKSYHNKEKKNEIAQMLLLNVK